MQAHSVMASSIIHSEVHNNLITWFFKTMNSPCSSVFSWYNIIVSYLFTKFEQFICNIHLLGSLKISAQWPAALLPAPIGPNFERLPVSEYCVKTAQTWHTNTIRNMLY